MSKKLGLIISALVVICLVIGIISMTNTESDLKEAQAYTSGINTSQISEEDLNSDINEKCTGVPLENSKNCSGKHSEADPIIQAPVVADENSVEASHAFEGYKEILAIGDSILLDIAPNLNKKYDNITIDGKVGRQMPEAVSLASGYAAFNAPGNAVIIELGTNGYFTDKQIDGLLDSFPKAHIFLINTRVPRSWESRVNDALKQKAGERENVTLIDWYSLASKHPEYFSRDGVHLTTEGVEALSSLISENLAAI